MTSGEREEVAYLLPRTPAEVDRLDVQHYALRETLGANFLAPVGRPNRVLDVGSGTGQWAYDLCAQFPGALVAGLDVAPSKPRAPANYSFVQANLLRGLPFRDGSFDFVHQRLMATSAVPQDAWPAVVDDLVRVTAPGGWVELVEVLVEVQPAGPATKHWFDLARELAKRFGLDQETIVRSLGTQLDRAGLQAVAERPVVVPVGEWAGRVGSWTASNLRALSTRLYEVFDEQTGMTAAEFGELLQAMRQEWEEHRSGGTFVFAFGRKR